MGIIGDFGHVTAWGVVYDRVIYVSGNMYRINAAASLFIGFTREALNRHCNNAPVRPCG